MLQLTVIVGVVILLTTNVVAQEQTEEFKKSMDYILKKIENFQNVALPNTTVFRKLKPDELIKYYHYKGEKHVVTSEDGYNLTLYRITGNKTHPNATGKQAILLQHGILGSSIDWLLAGPKKSFAFILADLGFDVWLANARGCIYSRGHKTFKLNQKEFWDFSWHEMGYYDLPAEIDYILSKTNNKKIIYTGHSMGTTIYYVMLSERPEYNDKILMSFSLAPIAFFSHCSTVYKLLAQVTDPLYEVANEFGLYGFDPLDEKSLELISKFCYSNSKSAEICKKFIFLIGGYSEDEFDQNLYALYLQHYPAGVSIKQIIHYGQMINSGHFRQFDYGREINKMKYNSIVPPDYKLYNIRAPTTLIYAKNDALTSTEDVRKLYYELPMRRGLFRVPHTSFNHVDFLLGKDAKKLVYDLIVRLILDR